MPSCTRLEREQQRLGKLLLGGRLIRSTPTTHRKGSRFRGGFKNIIRAVQYSDDSCINDKRMKKNQTEGDVVRDRSLQ